MIDFVRGKIDDLTPATVVIECAGGVGYALNISLNTFSAIQGKEEAKLYVYEAIREDAWVLFGFASKAERELFLLLLTVSGGPNDPFFFLCTGDCCHHHGKQRSFVGYREGIGQKDRSEDYLGTKRQGGIAGYRTSSDRWRKDGSVAS